MSILAPEATTVDPLSGPELDVAAQLVATIAEVGRHLADDIADGDLSGLSVLLVEAAELARLIPAHDRELLADVARRYVDGVDLDRLAITAATMCDLRLAQLGGA